MPCQRGKITNYIHAREASPHSGSRPPLQPLAPGPGGPLTSVRWMHDCTYLFTIIDFTTQWVEVIPLATTSTADCARALFPGWIAHFGVPAAITSDRGPSSPLLCGLLCVSCSTFSTCRPPPTIQRATAWWNGSTPALRMPYVPAVWPQTGSIIFLGCCLGYVPLHAITPAQAVFGSALVLPGQLVSDSETSLDQFLIQTQIKTTLSRSENLSTRHNTAAACVPPIELSTALLDATHVLVHRDGHVPPLAPLYDDPYTILHWRPSISPSRWEPRSRWCLQAGSSPA